MRLENPEEKSVGVGGKSFLPLDYHNVNKHRHPNEKTDFKVRGNADCYYYSCMVETGKSGKVNEFPLDKHSFSKAVTSFKNSSLIKSVNPSRRNESDYYENPQRTLDHSITHKLFDDMGNIAGSSENNISYYSNQGTNFNQGENCNRAKNGSYSTDDGTLLVSNSYKNNYRDSENEFHYDDGTYYKSNRRVAPVYMQKLYDSDYIDKTKI